MAERSWTEAVAELRRLIPEQAKNQFEMGDVALDIAPMGRDRSNNGSTAACVALARDADLRPETLLMYRKVSQAWPLGSRLPSSASWTVHQALMGQADRFEMLARLAAEAQGGWVTKAAARAAMDGQGRFTDGDEDLDDEEAEDTETTTEGTVMPKKRAMTATMMKVAVKAKARLDQADEMEVKSEVQKAEAQEHYWAAAELTVQAIDKGVTVEEWAAAIDRKPGMVRLMVTSWRRLNSTEQSNPVVRPDFWEAFELAKLPETDQRAMKAKAARRGKSVQAHAREERAKRSIERDQTTEEKAADLKRLLQDEEAAQLAMQDNDVRGPVVRAWSAVTDQGQRERKAANPQKAQVDGYLTISGRLSSARSGLRRSLAELQELPRMPDHIIAEMLEQLDAIELTVGWFRSYLVDGTATDEALNAILDGGEV